MDISDPGALAEKIVNNAKNCNARGVIGFTVKFCDPYLARIPMIREALQKESIPFLMLEGECTLGSIGQQQTRIDHMQQLAREYNIDGAINPCHWGCRQGTGVSGLTTKGLKDVDVPVLNLEIDCVDSRNLAQGQIETRLEAFFEMLNQ